MGRLEQKLFRIADELATLAEEERSVREELSYHRLINDDAQRDAVISESRLEQMEAGLTAADVARFERRLLQIATERQSLDTRRMQLLERLG